MNLFKKIILLGSFLLSVILLFLYSFTQIDLGLVFTGNDFLLFFQRSFQQIGYFQRSTSASIFVFIISALSISYLLLLKFLYKGALKMKDVFLVSILSAVILFISYNAFSYDLFNYIFDAKIVTYYHENPYERRALDYPQDSMLSFMHWTHRVYPYGPVWLGATIPLSYLSLDSLALSFLLFKSLAVFSYLGCVYLLKKIAEKIELSHAAFHVGLFALNPLVITESLVSAHNDIFMVFLAILAFYLFILKKTFFSFFTIILSAGVKFATILLLPVFGYFYLKQKSSINWQKLFSYSFIVMSVAVLAATLRTNFQPWYLLYILPFAALSKKTLIVIPAVTLSILAFLQYLPYIYIGNYDAPIPLVMAAFLSASLLACAVFLSLLYMFAQAKDIS